MHLVISDLPADVGPEIVSYPPDLIKAVRHGAVVGQGGGEGTCVLGPGGRDGGGGGGGGVDNYHI